MYSPTLEGSVSVEQPSRQSDVRQSQQSSCLEASAGFRPPSDPPDDEGLPAAGSEQSRAELAVRGLDGG